MRLSRANIPLTSEDHTHTQAIHPSPHYNLAPHFWPGFINLQHFCHSRWRNPVRLSKSGLTFLPASYPRGPPLSVVLTDWLSMIPAEGLASRPAASRVSTNNSKLIRPKMPLSRPA